ncbi:hypothetical protein [Pedobacter metabolipauper]|uniref:Uncharacterized protein n=1 Tax=Pedobacter metabolipauper TaxID=425513 RepID=A0A4R6SUK7_9SPHI|nr:hypothetical protein [Pedobacter metabolipauper]TDQ09410.1 hypothetical protein ATK78_1564 [Pedobacter metabolipauper]
MFTLYTIRTIPFQPVVVSNTTLGYDFKITDESGMKYYLGGAVDFLERDNLYQKSGYCLRKHFSNSLSE